MAEVAAQCRWTEDLIAEHEAYLALSDAELAGYGLDRAQLQQSLEYLREPNINDYDGGPGYGGPEEE